MGAWPSGHGLQPLLVAVEEPAAGYALAEGIIGLCALVFPMRLRPGDRAELYHHHPAAGTPLAVSAFKWTLSALMILPQSFSWA